MSDYEALLGEHKELRVMRERLLGIAAAGEEVSPEPDLRDRLAAELVGFGAAMSVHFEHEEQGGYFSEVQARRPELSAQIAKLQAQHQALVEQFADLAEEVRSGMALATASARVREALELLSQHECAEDALLQDGMLTDIGAND